MCAMHVRTYTVYRYTCIYIPASVSVSKLRKWVLLSRKSGDEEEVEEDSMKNVGISNSVHHFTESNT